MAWRALDPVTEDERCPWVMIFGVPGVMAAWVAVDRHFSAEPQPEHERVPADKVKVRDSECSR